MSTPHGDLQVRVTARTAEAADICSFELERADGAPLPAFSAGSHVDVKVEGCTRQYSLCNDPARADRYQIAILRDAQGRGGSTLMHERLQVGAVVAISPPRNHFPLEAAARRHLLLAGGIGITPLLAMAERLSAAGADFELHYCVRSRERAAFVARLERSPFAPRVRLHFDDGPPAAKLDLAALLGQSQPETHVYVCGPKGFMDAVLGTARGNGWPEAQLHYEFFNADVGPRAGDGSFEVELARSGRVVQVPADRSVTEALAAAGVEVLTSCEQGVCGTCVTRVLQGVPDHRDMYFTPQEQAANDQFTPCCSRAKSPRLVLDL